MGVFVSLLRGVNVGGHRKVRMAELTSLYETLGLSHVRSYLQSGNLKVETTTRNWNTIKALYKLTRIEYPSN